MTEWSRHCVPITVGASVTFEIHPRNHDVVRVLFLIDVRDL
jgi:hypothetical protein